MSPHLLSSPPDVTTATYRFYGASGQLLYVGITADLAKRLRAHERDSAWWAQVDSLVVRYYETRWEARCAEQAAIDDEAPAMNAARSIASVGPATNPDRKRVKSIRIRASLLALVLERCEREGITFSTAVDHALTAWVGEDEAT